MKRISMFILGAMMALALTACSSKGADETTAAAETAPDGMPMQTESVVDEKLPDADAEPAQIITVYHSNADATGVKQDLDGLDGEEITADGLVEKLIEYGVLEEGTDVLDFTVEGKTGILDLSQVPSLGTSGETIMLISVGNTFIENFELDQLKLLVNGENYTSGHIVHEDGDYLTFETKYKTMGQ